MLFVAINFLFVFLPLVWLGFFYLRDIKKQLVAAKIFLVAASFFFYAFWKFEYIFVLLCSIIINYIIAKNILKYSFEQNALIFQQPYRKILLIIGIAFNLCLLIFFKYSNFLIENLNMLYNIFGIQYHISLPHILLPLALSFVTFQQIAFLIDCYHNMHSRHIVLLDYCLFISFFPQLIAGPIVCYREMMPQFYNLCTNRNNKDFIAQGLFIFSVGLFKKIVLADNIAHVVNDGFYVVDNGGSLGFIESWAVSLGYSFQLYFDFSGYCDMAIGLGLLFGIVLPVNFNSPYKALNIAGFWRCWHITLGRFLRWYVYIPLGGNRTGKILNLRNLFLVAFLSGIWHGAGFGFIIWGVLHGVALCIHKIYQWIIGYMGLSENILFDSIFYKIFCLLLTFSFVNISWVFFRAETIQGALNLLYGMFYGDFFLPIVLKAYLGFLEDDIKFHAFALSDMRILFVFLIMSFFVCFCLKNGIYYMKNINNLKMILSAFLFAFSLFEILAGGYTPPFLYFNF